MLQVLRPSRNRPDTDPSFWLAAGLSLVRIQPTTSELLISPLSYIQKHGATLFSRPCPTYWHCINSTSTGGQYTEGWRQHIMFWCSLIWLDAAHLPTLTELLYSLTGRSRRHVGDKPVAFASIITLKKDQSLIVRPQNLPEPTALTGIVLEVRVESFLRFIADASSRCRCLRWNLSCVEQVNLQWNFVRSFILRYWALAC